MTVGHERCIHRLAWARCIQPRSSCVLLDRRPLAPGCSSAPAPACARAHARLRVRARGARRVLGAALLIELVGGATSCSNRGSACARATCPPLPGRGRLMAAASGGMLNAIGQFVLVSVLAHPEVRRMLEAELGFVTPRQLIPWLICGLRSLPVLAACSRSAAASRRGGSVPIETQAHLDRRRRGVGARRRLGAVELPA